MTDPRFLQIHTLSPYTGALLNRDASGLAKRLPYGGVLRTRVSSQCLKRHWRIAEDPHALRKIDGVTAALRSRELVTKKVIEPLRGRFSAEGVALKDWHSPSRVIRCSRIRMGIEPLTVSSALSEVGPRQSSWRS